MDEKTERIVKIVAAVGAGITTFVYLLYFVGRTYSQSYFATLNIPNGIIDSSFADYAFIGAQWHNLIIVLLFTAVVIGLFLFQFVPNMTNSRQRVSTGDKVFGLGYFVYFAVVIIFSAVVLSFSQLSKFVIAFLFIFPLGSAVWFLLVLSDKKLASYIKRGKVRSNIFIAATVAIIILFPYTCSTGWGTFSGIFEFDKNPHGYPLVELTSDRILIDDIKWNKSSDNFSYKTDESLLLVISNDKFIALKSNSKPNNMYIVKIEDILSMSVTSPPIKTGPSNALDGH